MDDSASRFWDKYILKTTSYNVPEGARRWYVKHAEDFIKDQSGRRLTTLTADDIENYLKKKGRNETLTDWQFRQLVDALRILFTDMVTPAWTNAFDWASWKDGARELPTDHATLARYAKTGETSGDRPAIRSNDKAINRFIECFPDLHSRFVAVIRSLQYSIRTEKTYLFWIARFVLHGGFSVVEDMQVDKIVPYLEHLAVDRNVAPNTQRIALNSLVFFYRHILKQELEGKQDYKRAKKQQRLPVVLSRDEINRLLDGITTDPYKIMASLLYGSGLRLMECIRLRICDLDFDYKQIVVRNGRDLHAEDLQAGYGEVHLPYALARKYPSAAKEFRWQYVFPSVRISVSLVRNTSFAGRLRYSNGTGVIGSRRCFNHDDLYACTQSWRAWRTQSAG